MGSFPARAGTIKVAVGDNEPEEVLLRRFKREVMRAGVIQECKRRQWSEKMQEKKKHKVVVGDDEPEEVLLRRFKREVMRAGVIQECKRRRRFERMQEKKKKHKARETARRNRRGSDYDTASLVLPKTLATILSSRAYVEVIGHPPNLRPNKSNALCGSGGTTRLSFGRSNASSTSFVNAFLCYCRYSNNPKPSM
ncbi:hypothetical protein BHM03_00039828 [Ensete ventricosum]|nr:hypothetical protein BHM03_00039828 [Ensete ventricosum]